MGSGASPTRWVTRIVRPGGLIVFQLPARHRYRDFKHFLLHNVYSTVARKILRVPTAMDTYGLPQEEVFAILNGAGARVLRVVENKRAGEEWLSLDYLATR